MQKRFRMDVRGINLLVGIFLVGFLLMSVPLLTSESLLQFTIFVAVVIVFLVIVWIGFAYGTYVNIDEHNDVQGFFFFFKGKKTPISAIVSIGLKSIFGGLMTEISIRYRREDGSLGKRGLASKQAFKEEDLRSLFEAINSINPNVDIPEELRGK